MCEPEYDVLGWGVVAVDDIFHVDEYPRADTKTEVRGTERRVGGLTSVALIAAGDLGGRPCYAGLLGDDDLSNYVIDTLRGGGVDVSHALRQTGARPIHAAIVVAGRDGSRTILYTLEGFRDRPIDQAMLDLAARTRVVFVDPFCMEQAEPLLSLARSRGIPVVADLEAEHAERLRHMLAWVDHLVLPAEAAHALCGSPDPAEAAARLARGRAAAVVTHGQAGCWYACGSDPGAVRHQPAFQVQVRNTTGCGDVFHGAYCLGVARSWPAGRTVAFASAAAAVRAEDSAAAGHVTDLVRVREMLCF